MTKRVEALRDAPPTSTRERIMRSRLWLMFDRDSDPADRSAPSKASEKLRELVEAPARGDDPWPPGGHQLHRRSIENYIPNTLLHHWANTAKGNERKRRVEAVNALETLRRERPEAAWQYNMKKGLLGDLDKSHTTFVTSRLKNARLPRQRGRLIPDSKLASTFKGLDEETRGALLIGFGKNIADQYQVDEFDWDASFADEFSRGPAAQPSREELLDSIIRRM